MNGANHDSLADSLGAGVVVGLWIAAPQPAVSTRISRRERISLAADTRRVTSLACTGAVVPSRHRYPVFHVEGCQVLASMMVQTDAARLRALT